MTAPPPAEPAPEPPAGPSLVDRPHPLTDIAQRGMWRTLLGTALTAAAGFGGYNGTGGHPTTVLGNLIAIIATLCTLATSLVAQIHLIDHGELAVTPVSDPQDSAGRRLVPEPGSTVD